MSKNSVIYKQKSSFGKGSFQLKNDGKSVKGNSWGGNYVLYTCIGLMFFIHIWDATILTFQGGQPILANYAFRETIRETRRAKTLATYARKRGPMIVSNIKGYSPLASKGVTHLEDAFGGLISGPPSLWKHGEIYVHKFAESNDIEKHVLTNFKTSAVHWNNQNTNPCIDRSIYIGGQKIPGENNVDFITVTFGFLKIDCKKSQQKGFLTILTSATHGGNLLGRIFEIEGKFSNETFPIYKTGDDGAQTDELNTQSNEEVSLKLREIGSLVENRGNGNPVHYQYLCLFCIAPFILWMLFSLRLAQVEIIMNVEVDGGKKNTEHGSARGSTTTASESNGSISDNKSDTSSEEKRSQLKTRETRHTKFIDDRMISYLWFGPLMHIFFIVTAFICMIYRMEDVGGVISSFLPKFGQFKINYLGIIIALISQEILWWILSIISRIFTINSDFQRALCYGYQYNKLRYLLRITNLLTCACLIIGIFTEDQDVVFIQICLISGCNILMEFLLIIGSIKKHPFDEKVYACQTAGLAKGYSLALRGISNYLVSQDRKGMERLNSNEYTIPGLGFSGKVADCIILGRPDLMMKGVINGKNVQIQLFETATQSFKFSKLDNAGDQQFMLKRHWIFHGRVGFTCP